MICNKRILNQCLWYNCKYKNMLIVLFNLTKINSRRMILIEIILIIIYQLQKLKVQFLSWKELLGEIWSSIIVRKTQTLGWTGAYGQQETTAYYSMDCPVPWVKIHIVLTSFYSLNNTLWHDSISKSSVLVCFFTNVIIKLWGVFFLLIKSQIVVP